MIPTPSPAASRERDVAPHGDSLSRSRWAQLHRSLGLALVPCVLVGAVAAIVANHTTGFAAPCPEVLVEGPAADLAARRAIGHLMVEAGLAGEPVRLIEGSAEWIEADAAPQGAHPDELPRWAAVGHLSGFELPPGVAAPQDDALVAFQVESVGRHWLCAVALDGALTVATADTDGWYGVLDSGSDDDVASVALVDLLAGVGLTWALSACVMVLRGRDRGRTDLAALATGCGLVLVFVAVL